MRSPAPSAATSLALCLARLADLAPGASAYRPVRDGRASPAAAGLRLARRRGRGYAADRGARRRGPGNRHDPAGRRAALGRPHGPVQRAGNPRRASAARGMTIVFVNTRAQSELLFQALWRLNAETLPIAIHHGSLELEQRQRVEAAMAAGELRAVVATSSLDLGIDWGGVDQVLQVGAPKGVSRLLQRVGRANHRMDEASRATAGAGQPLRGAGVRGGDPRRRRRRAGRRPAASGRPGRAGAASAGLRLRRAVSAGCDVRRSAPCRALCGPGPATISTTCWASSRMAATLCKPMNGIENCSATPRAWCRSARSGSPGSTA